MMGDVFLDAFLDTLKILPFLLVMNFVIELLEYTSKGLKADRILKGGGAPLIGTLAGVVPQCGFSVVATELYGKRRIALGTLLAVYIATSDEALPIMLSSLEGLTKILPLLIIKICFAFAVGYSTFGIEKAVAAVKRKKAAANADASHVETDKAAPVNADDEHSHEHGDGVEQNRKRHGEHRIHVHGCHRHDLCGEEYSTPQNPTKKQKAARVWNVYFKHPLLHTATVFLYIFVVNVVFGIIVYYVGEDRLAAFIHSTGYFQPLLAAVVGLIPNCAASVVITELYVVGGLSLGGAVAGLCVSAGIGYAVLIKQNRPVRDTVMIIALMFVLSTLLGIGVNGVMSLL